MQKTLRELADKQALAELVLRYARIVDRKDFGLLVPLYHAEATHDHGAMFSGSVSALVAWLAQSMVNMDTQHLVANKLFVLDGDTARGEIYTVNFHHFADRDIHYIAGGRYLDDYVRVDNQWMFMRRTRVIDWSEERPAKRGQVAQGLYRGDVREKDPAYQLLGPSFN